MIIQDSLIHSAKTCREPCCHKCLSGTGGKGWGEKALGRSRLVWMELILELVFQLVDRSADCSSWVLNLYYVKAFPSNGFHLMLSTFFKVFFTVCCYFNLIDML